MSSESKTDPTTIPDALLVAQALEGDKVAFGEIVRRYQNLVSSLTLGGCGSMARSEDLAQETFIAAWRKLGSLRDPEKLKPWLCGIARKLAANAARREARTPARPPGEPDSPEIPADQPSPHELAADREEEKLVWQALEEIPATYREPLILYYRQQHSLAEVAAALDLSEDAAKQRLSRGRRLLRDEVAGLIEDTLKRSRPGSLFSATVVAALPAIAPSVSVAAVCGTSHAAATTKPIALAGGAAALAGPLLGLLGTWIGVRLAIRNTRSPREREFVVQRARALIALVALFTGAMLTIAFVGRDFARKEPALFAVVVAGATISYLFVLVTFIRRGNIRQREIRLEDGIDVFEDSASESAPDLSERRAALAGGILGAICAIVFLPMQTADWGGVGIVLAAGLLAFLYCDRVSRQDPDRWRRGAVLAFAALGTCWMTLLNFRFAVWFPQLANQPDILGRSRIGINLLVLLAFAVILLAWRKRGR